MHRDDSEFQSGIVLKTSGIFILSFFSTSPRHFCSAFLLWVCPLCTSLSISLSRVRRGSCFYSFLPLQTIDATFHHALQASRLVARGNCRVVMLLVVVVVVVDLTVPKRDVEKGPEFLWGQSIIGDPPSATAVPAATHRDLKPLKMKLICIHFWTPWQPSDQTRLHCFSCSRYNRRLTKLHYHFFLHSFDFTIAVAASVRVAAGSSHPHKFQFVGIYCCTFYFRPRVFYIWNCFLQFQFYYEHTLVILKRRESAGRIVVLMINRQGDIRNQSHWLKKLIETNEYIYSKAQLIIIPKKARKKNDVRKDST